MTAETPRSPGKVRTSALAKISKYFGAYLLGILACVMLTPVEFELAGALLLPWYVLLSIPGYFLWFYWVFSLPLYVQWLWMSVIGLIPFAGAAWMYFGRKDLQRQSRLGSWRPLWICFPIGFVGTLGIYYTASASI